MASAWITARLTVAGEKRYRVMFRVGGSTAIHASSPLDRCLRDSHTAAAHYGVSPPILEAAGRAFLGLEPGVPWF